MGILQKQKVHSCMCAARKNAIYEDTYDEVYTNTKENIDVLILLEHKETSTKMDLFLAMCRSVFGTEVKYRIQHSLGCTPKGFSSNDTVANYLVCKKANIAKRTAKLNPKVILTTGRAIYSVTEVKNLRPEHFYGLHEDDNWFWSPDFKCKVFPIPALYLWIGKDLFEKVFVESQFEKVIEEVKKYRQPRIQRLEHIYVNDPNKLIRSLIDDKTIIEIAVDTESEGLNYFEDQLISIQFSWNGTAGHFLPFEKIDKQLLIELFLCQEKKFCFHQGQYDVKVLKANGITSVHCDFDTLLATYALNENRPVGLKPMTWIHTKHGGYEKDLRNELKKHSIKTFLDLPRDLLVKYACYDTIVTWQLWQYLKARLAEENEGVQRYYYEILIPAIEMLSEVELTGIGVDEDYLEKYATQLKIRAAFLEKEMQRLVGKVINFRSTKQVSEAIRALPGFVVLKNEEGEEVLSKKGELSLDKAALLAYAEQGFTVCLHLVEYNHLQKEISQLGYADKIEKQEVSLLKIKNFGSQFLKHTLDDDDEDEDDEYDTDQERETKAKNREKRENFLGAIYNHRLHGGLNLAGTDTGRLAGKGGLDSTVNFQNFTKTKSFRRIFVATPGFILCEADYKAHEVRLQSQIAGQGPLEKMILEDIDPHSFLAVAIAKELGLPEETHTYEIIFQKAKVEEDPAYFKLRDSAKTVIFSCLEGNTLVKTSQGNKKISEIVDGTGVFSKELQIMTRNGFETPTHQIMNENQEILDLELEDGSILSVTPDHGMIVLRNGYEHEIQAKDLQENDNLLRLRDV